MTPSTTSTTYARTAWIEVWRDPRGWPLTLFVSERSSAWTYGGSVRRLIAGQA